MTRAHSLAVVACIALLASSCTSQEIRVAAPFDAVVNEGFGNPLGFYDVRPRFSWKLPVADNVRSQSAYRIVVASDASLLPDRADLWDTLKVDSDQSTWIDYAGKALGSRQKVYWQAMYWDQDGAASEWSPAAHLELGLLENSDWQARWIGLPRDATQQASPRGYHFHRPQYLRREFSVDEPVLQARLYITAKGVFAAEINGQRVGNDVMTPGWTPYEKRIETLTYDVTDLIAVGRNAIGVSLADGWHSGRIAFRRSHTGETPAPRVISQLEITYESGAVTTVTSDGNWKATADGPIRMSDIYEGEDYDANFEMPGWSTAGFDAGQWHHVVQSDIDATVRLAPKRHAPVRDKRTMPAVAITRLEDGKLVFDLGQNVVGVAELRIPVKANQDVTVRFAEILEKDGTLYTDNYRSARSANVYTPREDGEIVWRPKFTFHGFRYVELSGFDADAVPQEDWVTGVVQYSDFDSAGHFESSHAKLNQLQSNIAWGLRGNFFDIPTDCPQRDERMGWTGDAQIFAATSIFNSDVHAFWASWLQSVRDEQYADGGIPFVVPNNRGKDSSSGWADAATIIPWQIYLRTGDKRLLEDNYDMMRRLVDYYQLSPDARSSELRSFGDWLQPFSENPEDNLKGDTPNDLIEAAYFAWSVQQTLNAAEVLGRDDDVAQLRALLDRVRADFARRFLDSDGRLTTPVETQTGYLLALGFELVPEHLVQRSVDHLVRSVNAADKHLRTGFLGTPLLAPVLSRLGHTDLAYELLFRETYPSWFYPINQGATTMWERWNSYSHEDGFGDATMNSFNHYAYGAIGEWLYEGIAGISPLQPGYKKILIAPTPGGPLESAKAEYDSVYGRIASAWRKTAAGLELEITIPPNTTAQVVIPASADAQVSVDGGDLNENPAVALLGRDRDNVRLEVQPGNYVFTTESALLRSEFIFDDAPFPSSHASTIEETDSGLVAAWFGGTHEQHPDVGIWVSHYDGGRWSTPVEVANGVQSPSLRYPAWNPVLFQPQDGPLLLFYKVGPSPQDWWGMLMSSDDGGRTWSTPVRLPDGILGPIKNKPIQLANGDILSPSSTEHDGWRVHFERSTDGGATWTTTGAVNDGKAIEAIQPSLLQYSDGRIQALGRTRNFKLFSIWSDDGGRTWGEMELLDLPNPSSGTDAVTLEDGRQLLVYNHNLREGTTNKGRSPLNVAVSSDGVNWSAALVLEDDPDAPHGFPYPAVIQTDDGLVHVTYTWQREVIRHAVIDPARLTLRPIVGGRWPAIEPAGQQQ